MVFSADISSQKTPEFFGKVVNWQGKKIEIHHLGSVLFLIHITGVNRFHLHSFRNTGLQMSQHTFMTTPFLNPVKPKKKKVEGV